MSAPNQELHLLKSPWTFWEVANSRDYAAAVRQLGDSFDSVERFWDYWNSVLKPSEIFGDGAKKVLVDGREIKAMGIFRKGIMPAWEDPANAAGCELAAVKPLSVDAVDAHWESIVFALIGEMMDSDDHICGARVAVRTKGKSAYKFEIWLRDMNEEKANAVRTRLAEALSVSNERAKSAYHMQENDFVIDKRGKEDSQTKGKKY